MNEDDEPTDNTWPELRESQTLTLDKLKNAGEAVIIDVGEGRDIHPRNKQTVANRLVRNALAKDYAIGIPHQSPRFKSMETKGNKAILTFDHVGTGLYTFDVREATGFAICGKDKKFVWAKGKLVGKRQSGSLGRCSRNPGCRALCLVQQPRLQSIWKDRLRNPSDHSVSHGRLPAGHQGKINFTNEKNPPEGEDLSQACFIAFATRGVSLGKTQPRGGFEFFPNDQPVRIGL